MMEQKDEDNDKRNLAEFSSSGDGHIASSSKLFESKLQTVSIENDCYACIFCKSCRVDEIKLGPLYYRDGVVTHYYCMLFSAALNQCGKDDEGILGFLSGDIMKEVRRSYRLKCVYCNIVGATVGCCNKKCRHVFHFPCGLKNGSNFQFFGNYESFCQEHHKRQKIAIKQSEWLCPICLALVSEQQSPVMSSCCKAAVFHKECMQKVALNAGYFFKCPTCNEGSKFVQEMRSFGIFVPDQDASWERDDGFQDLYIQYSKCDNETCLCGKGREYISEKGNWMLARCRLCGASGTHRQCSNLKSISNWACQPCLEVEQKAKNEKNRKELSEMSVKESNPVPEALAVVEDANDEGHVSVRSSPRIKSLAIELKDEDFNVSKVEDEDFDLSKIKDEDFNVSKVKDKDFNVSKVKDEDFNVSQVKDKGFNISQVKIGYSCFSYFPYNEEILKKYKKKTVLPDWRNLKLRVNLTDWLQKPNTKKKSNESQPQSSQACSSSSLRRSKIMIKPVNSPGKVKSKVRVLIKVKSSFEGLSGSCEKRKRKRSRIGRWNRGFLGKRQKHKRAKIADQGISRKDFVIVRADTTNELDQSLSVDAGMEIVPVSPEDEVKSIFRATKIREENITHARRRKQVFPSVPNKDYLEAKEKILDLKYSTSSGGDSNRIIITNDNWRLFGSVPEGGGSTSPFVPGQFRKSSICNLGTSVGRERIQIARTENSCVSSVPLEKFCSSEWREYVAQACRKPVVTTVSFTKLVPASESLHQGKPVSFQHTSGSTKSLLDTNSSHNSGNKIQTSSINSGVSSSDDVTIIGEFRSPAQDRESLASTPLHDSVRRIVMLDHTYTTYSAANQKTDDIGKPQWWSILKSRSKDVYVHATKADKNTPILTLGSEKNYIVLKCDPSAKLKNSPLRTIDINSYLDEEEQIDQTIPLEIEIWEDYEIIL